MRIVVNDHTSQKLAKLLREATDLTQKEFGKTINRSERSIRFIESGERHFMVETLLTIVKKHNLKIIIEKEEKDR